MILIETQNANWDIYVSVNDSGNHFFKLLQYGKGTQQPDQLILGRIRQIQNQGET
jgi:hypothetical protein